MNPAGELVKTIIQSLPEASIELPAQWLETLGKFRNVLEGIAQIYSLLYKSFISQSPPSHFYN